MSDGLRATIQMARLGPVEYDPTTNVLSCDLADVLAVADAMAHTAKDLKRAYEPMTSDKLGELPK